MPDGTIYDYTYDNNNQLSLISIPGQGFFTYNQYSWNMPSDISLPGGSKKENTYTSLMQPKSISVKDPAQNPLMTYNYQYSPSENITAKNTEHGNYAYQYDPLYRLTGATNPAALNESYTYDTVGNRLTSAAVTGTWSYNQNNELLNYDNVSYGYDANGNMTSKTDQTGTTTYTYDIDNRLIQISNPQSEIYNYYYDPFGRRLWKTIIPSPPAGEGQGEGVKYFLYADEGLVGEYDTSGTELKTYGYEPNSTWTTNPLFQKIGTNYYWYQNDHLGTPQKMTDSSGAIVWSAAYNAFGKANVTVATIENNLRFPGQYYDAETGEHYNWNRYYDANSGRYTQVDPIGFEAGDANLYRYAFSDPVSLTDPTGEVAPVVVVVAVWGVVEIGLSIYDIITTTQTLLDPCESLSTKLTTSGLFLVGMVAPGGGYGTIGKKLVKHHGTPREIIKQAPKDMQKYLRGKKGQPNIAKVPENLHKSAHYGWGGKLKYNKEFKQRLDDIRELQKREPTIEDYWRIREEMMDEYFGQHRF